ncbi:unnamed protein product [Adineta steineri]|uniref:Sodium-coupled monocarboxylate transporter 2 n=1 Tax=Adineta steineri TaxID=433720 RepID=A0A815BZW4_9BILA|nr:unnamed protein product [Adineta steineri]
MGLPTLSVIDYVVLVLLLLLSAVVGIIFGCVKSKKISTKEYFLADGEMRVFPTALSIMVSFLSAITILGTPSEVYMSGTMFWYQAAAWSIASMVTAFIFMPKFREMNFTSLILVGGFERAFTIASQGERIEFDNISFDPRTRHTIWSILIGNSFNALLTYGFNQMQVQRYMCVRSTRGAQVALLINIVGVASLILLSCLMGVILYAYYAGCDPFTAGRIQNVDQILPYFIMDTLGNKKGIPGLFLACAFSGSLSTISSGLNSMAAVIIEDIYKGLMRRKLNQDQQGFVSKLCSVVVGVIVLLLTYFISYLGSVINAAISLSSTLCGPIMGVFFLGFFFPKANRLGALIGFFSSLALQIWIFIGVQLTKHQRSNNRLPLSIANCTDINVLEIMNSSRTTTAAIHIK